MLYYNVGLSHVASFFFVFFLVIRENMAELVKYQNVLMTHACAYM